jgi:hypothetical protein
MGRGGYCFCPCANPRRTNYSSLLCMLALLNSQPSSQPAIQSACAGNGREGRVQGGVCYTAMGLHQAIAISFASSRSRSCWSRLIMPWMLSSISPSSVCRGGRGGVRWTESLRRQRSNQCDWLTCPPHPTRSHPTRPHPTRPHPTPPHPTPPHPSPPLPTPPHPTPPHPTPPVPTRPHLVQVIVLLKPVVAAARVLEVIGLDLLAAVAGAHLNGAGGKGLLTGTISALGAAERKVAPRPAGAQPDLAG